MYPLQGIVMPHNLGILPTLLFTKIKTVKKILLLSVILFSIVFAKAQRIGMSKNYTALGNFTDAKLELDKVMADKNLATKPEAYILKTAVYAGLSKQPGTNATPAGDKLATEADNAFAKYRGMDPALSFLNDPLYQNGLINFYSSLYTSGYSDYQNKNWQTGSQKFKKLLN